MCMTTEKKAWNIQNGEQKLNTTKKKHQWWSNKKVRTKEWNRIFLTLVIWRASLIYFKPIQKSPRDDTSNEYISNEGIFGVEIRSTKCNNKVVQLISVQRIFLASSLFFVFFLTFGRVEWQWKGKKKLLKDCWIFIIRGRKKKRWQIFVSNTNISVCKHWLNAVNLMLDQSNWLI